MINHPEEIKESTKYVVDNSEHVSISQEGLDRFCSKVNIHKEKRTDWLKKCPFKISTLSEKDLTHLMLTFNALSFSYWGEPYWQVTYNDTTYQRGSWSLIAALLRDNQVPRINHIIDPKVQKEVPLYVLKYILRGNREIPLIEERHKIMNELGDIISSKYDADFRNMINLQDDATQLLAKIIDEIPSFEDIGYYKGKKIKFYKRAQALVESMSMIYPLKNADSLTALADYILPRKLRDEGVLKYSPVLAETIDKKIPIASRSPIEIELRANTIQAVEHIKQELQINDWNLTSKEINDYLWLTGDKEITTFHRTRTTDY